MSASNSRDRLLRDMPSHAFAAEIGVWQGDFAERILAQCQPKKLFLVDPWTFQPQFPRRWYGGWKASSQADMDKVCTAVRERFADHPEVVIRREQSIDFFRNLRAGTLDWLYIDGDHSFDAVLADLRWAWSTTKRGGFITGDDYHWTDEAGSPSVQEAVTKFADEVRVTIRTIGGQYIIQKPVTA